MLLYAAFVVFGAGEPDAGQQQSGSRPQVRVYDLGVPFPGTVLRYPLF
jgi:hypothetical protein